MTYDSYVGSQRFRSTAAQIVKAFCEGRTEEALGEVFRMDVYAAAIMVNYVESILMPTSRRVWLDAFAARAAALEFSRRLR